MSANVVNRSISGLLSDNKLVLNSSRAARKMSFGTGWNTIRMAFRVSVSGSGNLSSTPVFAFGLCSGTQNVMGDAVTDAFVGGIFSGSTWTYTHDGHVPYYSPSQGFKFMGKTGTVYQDGDPTGPPFVSANYTGIRQTIEIEIAKLNSSTIAVEAVLAVGSSYITKDTPDTTFLGAVLTSSGRNPFSDYLGNHDADGYNTYSTPTRVTLLNPNTLDSICFSWNHTGANIEISDVAVISLQ